MRTDAVGMFWADVQSTGKRNSYARVMPPIPDTGWKPPREFPNLSAAKVLSIDTEAYDPHLLTHGPGWARGKSHMVGISVGTEDGRRWYFPFRHEVESQDNMNPDHVLAWARDTFGNPYQTKVGANLIYDIGNLRAEEVFVRGELVDVQYAEALLDERSKVALDVLGKKYLGEGKSSNLLYEWCAQYYGGDTDDTQRTNIYRAPPRLVGPYAEGDVDLPIRVAKAQYPKLVAEKLYHLFLMENALIPLLVDMRFAGVRVDIERAERLRADLLVREADAQARLRHLVGFEVNVNANDSLARAFDRMGIRYPRTAPSKNHPNGQPSFVKEWLEKCHNPLADLVNEIRKLEHLRGTFIESYILDSNINGMVYCQFHQLRADNKGTRSGRFSSSDPNLQNIPIRDEELGKLIRALFLPDLGHPYWRKYDYSQIEYRYLINFAVGPGADEARRMFLANPDMDYHDWALDMIAPKAGWDISTKELRKKWRRPLKNMNFGLIFGMGEGSMGYRLELGKKETRQLFNDYHKGVPFARPTMDACSEEIQRLGYITTILGRRSRFDLWEPSRKMSQAEREKITPLPYDKAVLTWGAVKRAYSYRGLNRRLQGSAADQLKTAMYLCYTGGVFAATGVPRLTVHDELDFSDPGNCDEAFREMRHIMETALPTRVPIRADCDRGPDWGNGEAFKEAA